MGAGIAKTFRLRSRTGNTSNAGVAWLNPESSTWGTAGSGHEDQRGVVVGREGLGMVLESGGLQRDQRR